MYSRTQKDSTKLKISQKMKQLHAQRSPEEKAEIARKQSDTMRRIWSDVPKHVTMADLLGSKDKEE